MTRAERFWMILFWVLGLAFVGAGFFWAIAHGIAYGDW